MASLSQIPVLQNLNFSVCKKGKMLHVLWTVTILKCPYIPKVFIYTRAVKMFIINLIVRQSNPPPPPSAGPQSRPSCTVNQ